jgi:glycine cleavage system H protein
MYPADLKYTRDHEWVRVDPESGEATIGITHFAQDQLGDVVFVDLPEVGRTLAAGETFGTIESVKTVSDLFCPVAGEVVAVNADLATHPEKINQAPHDTWMIRVRPASGNPAVDLLDAAAYEAILQ